MACTLYEEKICHEYSIFLTNEVAQQVLTDPRIKVAGRKSNCKVKLTNKLISKVVCKYKIVRYNIIQIIGQSEDDIERCNRLIERVWPKFSRRKLHRKKTITYSRCFEENDDKNVDNMNVSPHNQKENNSNNDASQSLKMKRNHWKTRYSKDEFLNFNHTNTSNANEALRPARMNIETNEVELPPLPPPPPKTESKTESTPQGSTPQGSTPQGSTTQGSTTQGSTTRVRDRQKEVEPHFMVTHPQDPYRLQYKNGVFSRRSIDGGRSKANEKRLSKNSQELLRWRPSHHFSPRETNLRLPSHFPPPVRKWVDSKGVRYDKGYDLSNGMDGSEDTEDAAAAAAAAKEHLANCHGPNDVVLMRRISEGKPPKPPKTAGKEGSASPRAVSEGSGLKSGNLKTNIDAKIKFTMTGGQSIKVDSKPFVVSESGNVAVNSSGGQSSVIVDVEEERAATPKSDRSQQSVESSSPKILEVTEKEIQSPPETSVIEESVTVDRSDCAFISAVASSQPSQSSIMKELSSIIEVSAEIDLSARTSPSVKSRSYIQVSSPGRTGSYRDSKPNTSKQVSSWKTGDDGTTMGQGGKTSFQDTKMSTSKQASSLSHRDGSDADGSGRYTSPSSEHRSRSYLHSNDDTGGSATHGKTTSESQGDPSGPKIVSVIDVFGNSSDSYEASKMETGPDGQFYNKCATSAMPLPILPFIACLPNLEDYKIYGYQFNESNFALDDSNDSKALLRFHPCRGSDSSKHSQQHAILKYVNLSEMKSGNKPFIRVISCSRGDNNNANRSVQLRIENIANKTKVVIRTIYEEGESHDHAMFVQMTDINQSDLNLPRIPTPSEGHEAPHTGRTDPLCISNSNTRLYSQMCEKFPYSISSIEIAQDPNNDDLLESTERKINLTLDTQENHHKIMFSPLHFSNINNYHNNAIEGPESSRALYLETPSCIRVACDAETSQSNVNDQQSPDTFKNIISRTKATIRSIDQGLNQADHVLYIPIHVADQQMSSGPRSSGPRSSGAHISAPPTTFQRSSSPIRRPFSSPTSKRISQSPTQETVTSTTRKSSSPMRTNEDNDKAFYMQVATDSRMSSRPQISGVECYEVNVPKSVIEPSDPMTQYTVTCLDVVDDPGGQTMGSSPKSYHERSMSPTYQAESYGPGMQTDAGYHYHRCVEPCARGDKYYFPDKHVQSSPAPPTSSEFVTRTSSRGRPSSSMARSPEPMRKSRMTETMGSEADGSDVDVYFHQHVPLLPLNSAGGFTVGHGSSSSRMGRMDPNPSRSMASDAQDNLHFHACTRPCTPSAGYYSSVPPNFSTQQSNWTRSSGRTVMSPYTDPSSGVTHPNIVTCLDVFGDSTDTEGRTGASLLGGTNMPISLLPKPGNTNNTRGTLQDFNANHSFTLFNFEPPSRQWYPKFTSPLGVSGPDSENEKCTSTSYKSEILDSTRKYSESVLKPQILNSSKFTAQETLSYHSCDGPWSFNEERISFLERKYSSFVNTNNSMATHLKLAESESFDELLKLFINEMVDELAQETWMKRSSTTNSDEDKTSIEVGDGLLDPSLRTCDSTVSRHDNSDTMTDNHSECSHTKITVIKAVDYFSELPENEQENEENKSAKKKKTCEDNRTREVNSDITNIVNYNNNSMIHDESAKDSLNNESDFSTASLINSLIFIDESIKRLSEYESKSIVDTLSTEKDQSTLVGSLHDSISEKNSQQSNQKVEVDGERYVLNTTGQESDRNNNMNNAARPNKCNLNDFRTENPPVEVKTIESWIEETDVTDVSDISEMCDRWINQYKNLSADDHTNQFSPRSQDSSSRKILDDNENISLSIKDEQNVDTNCSEQANGAVGAIKKIDREEKMSDEVLSTDQRAFDTTKNDISNVIVPDVVRLNDKKEKVVISEQTSSLEKVTSLMESMVSNEALQIHEIELKGLIESSVVDTLAKIESSSSVQSQFLSHEDVGQVKSDELVGNVIEDQEEHEESVDNEKKIQYQEEEVIDDKEIASNDDSDELLGKKERTQNEIQESVSDKETVKEVVDKPLENDEEAKGSGSQTKDSKDKDKTPNPSVEDDSKKDAVVIKSKLQKNIHVKRKSLSDSKVFERRKKESVSIFPNRATDDHGDAEAKRKKSASKKSSKQNKLPKTSKTNLTNNINTSKTQSHRRRGRWFSYLAGCFI